MKSIEYQMKTALGILNKLEVIDPHCILAGGAPRDWYFGNSANDLDFYFTSTATTITANKKQLEYLFGSGVTLLMDRDHTVGRDNEMYASMTNIRRIWELNVDGTPVQLIQLNKPGDQWVVVDSMDVSICKAWWIGGEVKLHKDFKITEKSGIMFLKEGYSWGGKHAIKMASRFPRYIKGSKEQAISVVLRKALEG